MKNTVLHTQNLRIGYNQKGNELVIAEEISVAIETGKLVSIVGANGVGKSTLLRTLIGIQKPLQGDVFLNEKLINTFESLALAQNMSVVLTEKLPTSNLSVYELVALGRQPYTNWLGSLTEADKSKIQEAIELTEIGSIVHKKHYEISDGQLQKVLIARAIAQDTPLIVLDEPTTHLDLHHKISVFKLLKKLVSETNKSVLFSTHDIDLAIQLSDEMIVMTQNNLVQDSPCKLIEQGIFNSLFQDEDITFDAQKGKFVFR